jgi:GntR family transcriptional regulator, transcriptional repressor for pyruvate dehydrogenase complex
MPHDFLLGPLHAPPAYAAVVDRLRRAVALGVLLPGDRLPAERTLAEGLEVSRVTVREALRVLQGEGLLITRRGSGGTTVSPTATSIRPGDSGYDDRLAEVFEVRLAVETMAARLAAQRGLASDVERLVDCQTALAASRDVNSFRRADSQFHLTVASISGNSMLRQMIEDARAAAFAWLDRRRFTVLHESSVRGHAAVIEAIRRHDPEAAATAMGSHIEQAREEVVTALATPDEQRGEARQHGPEPVH